MPNCYIAWDGDHIGRQVGRASLNDDAEELRRISHSIDRGNEIFKSWVLSTGGNVVSYGGDEGRAEVPADKLDEVEKIREQYETATGSTVSVGIGMKLSESDKALVAAKLKGGDQIVFYTPDVDAIIEQAKQHHVQTEEEKIADAYLGKAAMNQGVDAGFMGPSLSQKAAAPESPVPTQGEHSEAQNVYNLLDEDRPLPPESTHAGQDLEEQFHGAAQKQEAEDRQAADEQRGIAGLKAQVVEILKEVKQQAPVLEQLKQATPEVYESIMKMVQAMLVMAKELLGEEEPVQKAEKEQLYCSVCKDPLDKDGHCKVKAHWKLLDKEEPEAVKPSIGVLDKDAPNAGSFSHQHLELPVGTTIEGSGKTKIMHQSGKTGWVQTRAGAILSQDPAIHLISSRNPGGK